MYLPTIQKYNVKEPMERFFNKINVSESGCWLWTGYVHKKTGYALFHVSDVPILIHRFSYSVFNGALDESLTVDHLCRVRHCANPEHLEQVTLIENIRRTPKYQNPRCPRGHLYSHFSRGQRQCVKCMKAAAGKCYEKHKDEYNSKVMARYWAKRQLHD